MTATAAGSTRFPISSTYQQHRGFSVSTENLESLGDSITSAVVVSWSKEPGDSIKEDDVIAVVETDKVTMDIKSKKSGVFVGGLVEKGAEITVGSPLYKMDTSVKEAPVSTVQATPVPPPVSAAPTALKAGGEVKLLEIPVPIMGESITTGVLASWSVKTNDFIQADQVVASIETDKVSVEVRSPQAGKILQLFSAEGDEVNVGKPLFTIDTNAVGTSVATPAVVKPAAKEAAPTKTSVPAVASAKPASAAASTAAPSTASTAKATTAPVGDRSESRVKLSRMRQRIATRLKEAQNTAAMLTTFQEVDMTNLIELRNNYKDTFEKVHVRMCFTFLFVLLFSCRHICICYICGFLFYRE